MIRLIVTPNPFEPHRRVTLEEAPALTIWGALRLAGLDDGQPVIVAIDGDWILRDDWDREIPDGARVDLRRLVAGGGGQGKATTMSVAMIVAGGVLLATGVGTAAGVGLLAGGSAGLASSFLIPKPAVPAPLAQDSASPTYSVSAGQQRRIGQPIEVVYGRHRVVPSLVSEAWATYESNQQVLHMVLCLGHGHFEFDPIADLSLADSPLASFAGADGIEIVGVGGTSTPGRLVSVQVVQPGESVTAFHDFVTSSSVVQGQDLPVSGSWVGPFPTNPAGSDCESIGIDLVAPRGLMDSGSAISVGFAIEARPIDDSGDAMAGWSPLVPSGGSTVAGDGTLTPVRRSFVFPRPSAYYQRWEIRVRRTTGGGSTTSRSDQLVWGGLRGFLVPVRRYPKVRPGETDPRFPVTMLAVRVVATERVTGDVVQRLSAVVTRKLPTWNGTTWSAPVATRNPAWAFADIARNSVYGGGLPDSRIDLAALLSLAATWSERDDHFDAVFDQAVTTWDALTKVARVARATPVLIGGLLTCVRDQRRATYAAAYTPASIVSGSLSIAYRYRQADDPDGVRLSYIDPDTWQPAHVWSSVTGTEPTRPAEVDLFGCTDRAQAQREADHLARLDAYQRKTVTWTTELDGFLPQIGDKIALSHDLPGWGQSGVVLAVATQGAGVRLTVSEPLTWSAGTHAAGLRRPDGTLEGPFVATQVGGVPDQVDLATTPGFTLRTGLDVSERTAFLFGPTTAWRNDLILTGIAPRGDSAVELTAVPYSSAIYDERLLWIMADGSADYDPATVGDHVGYIAADTELMPNDDAAYIIQNG